MKNGSEARATRGLRFRRLAVFSATLLLAAVAGWRLLPTLEPSASVQPYRVRVKVELPASAGLPESTDEIRAELTRPESIQDALAAAGIDSHTAGVGPAEEVGRQIEIETRAANSGFELLVSLPQVGRIDAPAAAIVVNRLVEAWLAGHQSAQMDSAQRAHDAAQLQLDLARRQMATTTAEYESLVNQMFAVNGPSLGSSAGQNVAEQATTKMKANLERRVAELRAHRTELLETRTSEHPDVVAANEELNLLETRLQQLQIESPSTESAATGPVSLRDQLKSVRRRLESMRTSCDRLAAEERATYDRLVIARDRASLVWFPATAVVARTNSTSLTAWRAVVGLTAVLLALLATLLLPRPPAVLRSVADIERAVGAPVLSVIAYSSGSAAA